MGSEFWNRFVGQVARKPKVVSQNGWCIGIGIVSQDGVSVCYINLREEDALEFAEDLLRLLAKRAKQPSNLGRAMRLYGLDPERYN